MKLFIVGAGGQLGKNLLELCRLREIEVCAYDRQALNITELESINRELESQKPTCVINAAAYTAVDKAESEPEKALAVNHLGAENLAKACAEADVPLVHISTDYVFDGKKTRPYREEDQASPAGVYGLSKLRGEMAVRDHLQQHIILRVSWVFGFYGNNFVKTIQRLAREREELSIVSDQRGCPTSTENICDVILSIVAQLDSGMTDGFGTYHYCDSPESDWFEFANAIVDETRKYELLAVKHMRAISTEAFPTAVIRPMNSRMDCAKLREVFGIEQSSWRVSLERLIKRLA